MNGGLIFHHVQRVHECMQTVLRTVFSMPAALRGWLTCGSLQSMKKA